MKTGQTAYVRIGIAVTTLDFYLRRDGAKGRQRLLPMRVVEEEKERGSGFTLALGNGRRIELAADFGEVGHADLVIASDVDAAEEGQIAGRHLKQSHG